MAKKVPDSLLREWNDGDVVFAKDYKQERRILQTAINDNWDRMIKQYRVLDANGGIIETQNLDTAINTIRFKEGKYITLALDTDTSTLTIETRAGSVDTDALADDAVSTSKIQNGAVSTIKIADLSITAQKLADGSVTGIKLGANSVTEGKIADNSIRGSHIQDGTITIEKLDPDIFSPVESAEMAAHRNATPLDHPHDSVTDQHIGTRTVDDGQAPTSNTSFLSTLVSWLANRIRAITGESSWRTAPATTLKAVKAHMDNKSNPHGTTKEDVGLGQLVNERQASKSAFDNHVNASNPHSGSASTTALNNHTNSTGAHGATRNADPNRIIIRDSQGRARIVSPSADQDIANKWYVDSEISSKATPENVTLINTIHADVDGSEYPFGVTGMSIISGEDGYPINVGTVLNINPTNVNRFVQLAIYNGTSSGLQGNIYVRNWRSAEGWSEWVLQHNTNNLDDPARTGVANIWNSNQVIEDDGYRYWGVRRNVSGTEYGAEVAVSAGGNAQLSKRENGNIIASISLYSENDARIANNRIWHEGNLSNPARADGFNSFKAEQQVKHNGLYMFDLERSGSTNPARFRVHLGHGRFNISPGESTSNTTFTIAQNGYVGIGTAYNSAGPSAPFHVGENARFDGTVTVGGTQVALQNGNYANLRARATTKADVGLSRASNIATTSSSSAPSGGSSGDVHHRW